jgi:hypothetical protein
MGSDIFLRFQLFHHPVFPIDVKEQPVSFCRNARKIVFDPRPDTFNYVFNLINEDRVPGSRN